ncbi:MAG TPA: hypothetical protein DCW71_07740 [Alistipes sp.]|uniref:TetR/AcrR family transcriptional regulator n=1 Tax=uncultured Alistipes sp. TaxID=538949 RepID=UPI000E9ACB2E|nr:TetR/AcrR family transcriptional regulator [uncultured Alistipes sp.]HAW65071.1 hypothetical protein [Alistipes sp.]HJC76587.1 TetR/AcrR family transcriptional regulator [Candidatus Alistipes excrementavium]
MKHSVDTRRLIIEDMQRLMIRDGLRAVRINELASHLSISKRTLYELFTDKLSLIDQSLTALFGQWEESVAERLAQPAGSYEKLVWLLGEYVRQLNVTGIRLLRELHAAEENYPAFVSWLKSWKANFCNLLCDCIAEGDCIADTQTAAVTRGLMMSLFVARLNGIPRNEQYDFGCTILRGISTPAGTELLERLKSNG